jgi:hypothetical protein
VSANLRIWQAQRLCVACFTDSASHYFVEMSRWFEVKTIGLLKETDIRQLFNQSGTQAFRCQT